MLKILRLDVDSFRGMARFEPIRQPAAGQARANHHDYRKCLSGEVPRHRFAAWNQPPINR
ncbi:MAG: hypothetical protein C0478_00780 [Planctomyces sp.]|nr:hypothetical protein [Planctomyces sp.]